MQFNTRDGPPSTWDRYAVDGNHDGTKDIYDPADAIPSAANYLRELLRHADGNLSQAILGYNHSQAYVNDVLARARRYAGETRRTRDHRRRDRLLRRRFDVPSAPPTSVMSSGSRAAGFRALPAWAMAAGRAPQLVDARIHGNVVWILRRYHLRVTAARESGHQTHGDGTAVDLVPADGTTQPVWDASAGRTSPKTSAGRPAARARHPPRLPARARDPVHRLRRLPQPRLAPHLHRHLPRPPPHLPGLRLLWLKHALAPLRVGRRLPTAAGRRRGRERSAAMSSRFSRSYVPVRAPSRASGRSIEPPRHWRGRLARWRPRDLLRWGVIVTPAARDDASDAEAWRASSPIPGDVRPGSTDDDHD